MWLISSRLCSHQSDGSSRVSSLKKPPTINRKVSCSSQRAPLLATGGVSEKHALGTLLRGSHTQRLSPLLLPGDQEPSPPLSSLERGGNKGALRDFGCGGLLGAKPSYLPSVLPPSSPINNCLRPSSLWKAICLEMET